jgi:hypothetical protein
MPADYAARRAWVTLAAKPLATASAMAIGSDEEPAPLARGAAGAPDNVLTLLSACRMPALARRDRARRLVMRTTPQTTLVPEPPQCPLRRPTPRTPLTRSIDCAARTLSPGSFPPTPS